MKENAKLLLIGGCAGAVNGLFGAGGGLFLVPLLIRFAGLQEKKAFATSVAIILPLTIASYVIFCINGGNVWQQAWPYALGGIAGGVLSARLFRKMPVIWIHRLFGILILYGGIKAVFF